MRSSPSGILVVLTFAVLISGCESDPVVPTSAEVTFGSPVTTTDAIPAPAVAAEPNRYAGRRITIDGRLLSVGPDGCTIDVGTDDGPPLRIAATRTNDGTCTWQVPADLSGIAAATGTLRTDGEMLQLSANGVEVTPVQITEPDS